MDSAYIVRSARRLSGLSLRQAAALAGTSHSTLSAYESGRKVPSVTTLDRIVRAANFDLEVRLRPRPHPVPGMTKGEELAQVLELASEFPARHSRKLLCPIFGRRAGHL